MPANERTSKQTAANKIVRGKWTRSYRWGSLDCMDIHHCDFLHLRGAVFYHMRTLQKYTREYLLEKFRVEYQPTYAANVARMQRSSPVVNRMPQHIPQAARPVLAIDTAPNHVPNRHASHSISHSAESGMSSGRTAVNPELSPVTSSSAVGSQRVRTKKTNVACNFCRSRKLKCDGGRPACSQCFKRSHPCDYTPSHRRRGTKKRKSDDGSESDLEMDMESGEPSGDMEPSMSPDIPSQPHSRRNSNAVDMMMENKLPPIDRPEQHNTVLPPISHPSSMMMQGPPQDRGYPMQHELPPIATLPAPTANDMQEMQTLAPLRNQADMQPPSQQQRRRTSSAASTKGRQNGYGSKIVACNFCRARKTRCDGGHPACSSCARRQLPCNYVNDPSSGNPKGRPKTAGGSSAGPSAPPSRRSSPTAQTQGGGPLAGIPNGFMHHIRAADVPDHRSFDMDVPPSKKMRITDDLPPMPTAHAIAVSSAN